MLTFFLAELGDTTQVATAARAAQLQAVVAVVLGTTVGMMAANVPVVLLSHAIAGKISLTLVRALSGLLFDCLDLYEVSDAMTMYVLIAYNVCTRTITWDPDKNQQLQRERDVSFDDVLLALMTDQVLADIPHPRPERYPGQRLLIVRIDNEAYVVPYVTSEEGVFLKTIFPSRKARREYL